MNLRCEDCDWTGTDDQAEPAKDIEERHSIGCVYSDLECPECGSLCYPTEEKDQFPWALYVTCKDEAEKKVREAAPDLLQALKDLTKAIDLSKLNVRKDFSLLNAHACAMKAIHKVTEGA